MQDKNDPLSLLKEAEHLPLDGGDDKWLYLVTKVLRLPGCYVPAAKTVMKQGRIPWSRLSVKGANPVGYIITAVRREALKMGLAMDRYKPNEPWIPTKERPPRLNQQFDAPDYRVGRVALPVPEAFSWSSPEKKSKITYENSYEDWLDKLQAKARERTPQPDPGLPVPQWLCMPDGCTIDWTRVAHYAVQKPRMVPAIGKALKLRVVGCTRADVLTYASNRREARELENALKWIDQNRTRIAALFERDKAPVPTLAAPRRPKFISPFAAMQKVLRKPQEDPAQKMITSPALKQHRSKDISLIERLELPFNVRIARDGDNLVVARAGSDDDWITLPPEVRAQPASALRELIMSTLGDSGPGVE